MDSEGTSSCWFLLGHSLKGHGLKGHAECHFRSMGCVRALGLLWSWLGFVFAGTRISVGMAAHWLQTYISCLVRNPNLPIHSCLVVEDGLETVSHSP